MKLRELKDREYKGTKYIRYQIQLPTKLVQDLGWKDGDDIESLEVHVVEDEKMKRFILLKKKE